MALPTQLLAEPARNADMSVKSRVRPDADHRRSRDDDRDFASVMSDRARDAERQSRKSADAQASDRARTDAARSSREAASDEAGEDKRADASPDPAAAETPRRQVTIPDLPARPGAATASADAAKDTAANRPPGSGSQADVVSEDAAAGLRVPDAADDAAAAHISEASVQTAARTGAAAAQAGQPPSAAAPRAAPADARSTAAADPATGRASDPALGPGPDGLRTAPGEAVSDSRPAVGMAQPVPTRNLPREAAQAADSDRAAPRAREATARTVETPTPAPATPPASPAQNPAAAQLAVLQPLTRDAIIAKEKSDALLSMDGEAESLRFDLRGSSTATGTQQAGATAGMSRTDVARGVAVQIGEMMRAMPDRPIDVSLSPEELGRVRLSISTGEGGVTLHVLAERPETLELMRRHADMLARELADLGFTSIDLAFGQGKDPGAGEGDADADVRGGPAQAGDDADAAPDGPVNRMVLGPDGGLDIRI